jgi:tetratricopeptide (TPR) repeat protein
VPDYVAPKLALAVLEGQTEEGFATAESQLSEVLDNKPDNVQALIERARLRAQHKENLEGAEQDARRIVTDLAEKAGKGQVGWAHLVLARTSRLRGDFTSMSANLDHAIDNSPPADPAFAYKLAGALMQLYRMVDAFEQMDRALNLRPKKPAYLQRMARVLLELDDPIKATPYIKAAPAREIETQLLAARRDYAKRNYRKAEEKLGRVIAQDTDNVEARMYLALTRAARHKTTEALQALEKLAAKQPKNHRLHLAIAQVRLQTRDFKQMHDALKKAWRITKLDPLAQTLSGHMSVEQHDYRTAEKRYRRALRTRPEYWPARVGLAELLVRTGRLEEAKKQPKQLAEIDKGKPDVLALHARIALAEDRLDDATASIGEANAAGAPGWVVARIRGEIALEQRQYGDALAQLTKAKKLAPRRDADLLVLLGQAQLRSGQVDAAYDSFHDALRVDGKHPEALIALGRIAIRDREYPIAIKRLNDAIEAINARMRPPELKAVARAVLGQAYLSQGDEGRAITNLQDAIDLDVNAAEPHYTMGLTYDKLDRPQRSIGYYEKAVELDEAYINAYERLGRAYAKLGDTARAVRFYKEYLKHDPPAAKARAVQTELRKLGGG